MTVSLPSRATLVDLRDKVGAADVSPVQRQNMLWALNCLGRCFNRPLAAIPADLRTISVKLRQSPPPSLRRPALSNLKSQLRAIFALVGPIMPGRMQQPMSEAWGALLAQVPAKYAQYRLSRVFRWLSAGKISPDQVSAPDLERFRIALAEQALTDQPEQVWRVVACAWNLCAAKVAGWPQIRIALPSRQNTYSLPWSDFPSSLLEDVDRWSAHVSGADLLDDGPIKPLGPVTLKGRRHMLQTFASALVHDGVEPRSLASIADLVTLANYKRGLRYLSTHRKLGPRSMHHYAFGLKSIAKNWVRVDDACLQSMRTIVKKLDPKQTGLTEKNTRRLTPLKDPKARERLLKLPQTIRAEIERGKVTAFRSRVLAQIAVAIEILLMAPIRIGNLASLRLDYHLHVQAKSVLITIPAGEVKNDKELAFELPAESVDILRWYLSHHRDAAQGCDFLFPGEKGRHKAISTLRIQMMGTIKEYVGVEMNPHLFRHFAAWVYLKSNPGHYEVVRLLLGHKRIETTIRFYAAFDSEIAASLFDQEIIKLRRAGAEM